MTQTIRNSEKAVIAAADQPATMDRLRQSGNPATRRAAGFMNEITAMHSRNDYDAKQNQCAQNALYYMPMAEIERLCAAYDAA